MNEEEEKAVTQILEAIKVLGWSMAIPNGGGTEDDGKVHGLIVGEQAYIDYVLSHLE